MQLSRGQRTQKFAKDKDKAIETQNGRWCIKGSRSVMSNDLVLRYHEDIKIDTESY